METTITTFALSILFILFFVQLGFIYYLLSQRKFKIKNVDVELENFLNQLFDASTKSNTDVTKVINSFKANLDKYDESQNKTKDALDKFVNHIINNIDVMKEDMDSIKKLAIEKEEKIKRYEDGYDKKILNQFLKELFRILEFIKEEQEKEYSGSLKEIEEDILLLLENNGINKINLEEIEDLEKLTKFAKIIRTEKTNLKEKNSTLNKILRDGYYIQLDNEKIKIVKHAEVIINKYKGSE